MLSAERISPGETVKGAGDRSPAAPSVPWQMPTGEAASHLEPAWRPAGHPGTPKPQRRAPGDPSCLQPSDWAALDLPEPTELGKPVPAGPRPPTTAGLSCVHSPDPLVPEGPHGDAVFPHEAPHAAATLHAWPAGSGQPGSTALPSGPRAAPAGGLALRSLPSPWWEGDREGPGRGEGAAVSTPQVPASHLARLQLQPLPASGARTPDPAAPRHNLALLASCQEPAVALGQGSSESLGGPGEGRPPGAQGWPSVQRPAWDGEGGGREARAVRILRQLPRGLNPTPACRGPAHRSQDKGAVCPGSRRKPG